MVTTLIWPQSSCFVVKPCTDVFQRVQLRMVCKNHATAGKAARLAHNRAPIAQQSLKVPTSRTTSTENIASNSFLWKVENHVLWCFELKFIHFLIFSFFSFLKNFFVARPPSLQPFFSTIDQCFLLCRNPLLYFRNHRTLQLDALHLY